MKARIFDVKRFAVHDGDGIRTTVFFKGCSLKCVWCHNPEGISHQNQIMFYSDKCVGCGECTEACKLGGHALSDKMHLYSRSACIGCGDCTVNCYTGALKQCGYDITIDELMVTLLEDKNFYDTSGGGVTLSGGECLLQADFCRELLCELQKNGINTAVDTCGFVATKELDKVIPFTDIFLYDLKAFDEDVHIRCTGQSNKLIFHNLEYLDSLGKRIELRIPLVPGYNDSQMEKLQGYVNGFKSVIRVKILPYHNYSASKYSALDMENTLPQRLPTADDVKRVQNMFDPITKV